MLAERNVEEPDRLSEMRGSASVTVSLSVYERTVGIRERERSCSSGYEFRVEIRFERGSVVRVGNEMRIGVGTRNGTATESRAEEFVRIRNVTVKDCVLVIHSGMSFLIYVRTALRQVRILNEKLYRKRISKAGKSRIADEFRSASSFEVAFSSLVSTVRLAERKVPTYGIQSVS